MDSNNQENIFEIWSSDSDLNMSDLDSVKIDDLLTKELKKIENIKKL